MNNANFYITLYRRLKSSKLKAAIFFALRAFRRRYLVTRIDTINLCNLTCRMCYYSALKTKRKAIVMHPALFNKIANDLFWRTKLLYLSCQTEPLMNKHFSDILDIVGQHKVPFVSFTTNGMLLSEKVIERCITNKISEIIISVDGSTAATFEDIRRGANWEKLISKLEMIHQLKEKFGSKLPELRFNFTLMKRNIDELPGLVDFAKTHYVKTIRLRHLLSFKEEYANMDYKEEKKYLEKFNQVINETERRCQESGIELIRPPLILKTCHKASSNQNTNLSCMLPWFNFHIYWNGDIEQCSNLPGAGNLKDTSFDNIYNSPFLRKLRKEILRKVPTSCIWNCDASIDQPSA